MSTPAPLPAPQSATAAWTAALDLLEAHADRAEAALRGLVDDPGIVQWEPPAGAGPLPVEFVPRARLLLERQQALMAAIPGVVADARSQHKVVRRVGDATTTPRPPIYLDVTA